MGYIEENLVPGEIVLYKTRLHWMVLVWPLLWALILAGSGIALLVSRHEAQIEISQINGQINDDSYASYMPLLGVLLILGAGIIFAAGVARRNATEVAVSNRRVLIKTGLLGRRSIEVLLSKIESIGVNEPIAGRLLGYGTVLIRGTGGTFETFGGIAHPNEFRRQVQQQVQQQVQPQIPPQAQQKIENPEDR